MCCLNCFWFLSILFLSIIILYFAAYLFCLYSNVEQWNAIIQCKTRLLFHINWHHFHVAVLSLHMQWPYNAIFPSFLFVSSFSSNSWLSSICSHFSCVLFLNSKLPFYWPYAIKQIPRDQCTFPCKSCIVFWCLNMSRSSSIFTQLFPSAFPTTFSAVYSTDLLPFHVFISVAVLCSFSSFSMLARIELQLLPAKQSSFCLPVARRCILAL